MNFFLKILDYVYLARPILFFPGWTTLIAGHFCATGESRSGFPVPQTVDPLFWSPYLVLAMAALGCAMGGGAVLNQLKDIESDQKNKKLFLLDNQFVPVSHAYLESIILIAVSLFSAIAVGWSFFIILFSGILIAGYAYNFPPFNLKNYPIGGLWANMMMGWVVFALGWALTAEFNAEMVIYSAPYLFYNSALYLLTTLPDMEGDLATQKITFPVRYGFRNTLRFSFFLYLLAIFSAVLLSEGFLFLVALSACPFFGWAFFSERMSAVIIAVKMGIFFFSLGICVKFPLFFGMIVLAYFITRFYYKKRFAIEYPSFKGR